MAYSQWSRYRRIDVVDRPDEAHVYSDGLIFHGYRKNDSSHAWDPRALPARIAQAEPSIADILIIGAGTGSELQSTPRPGPPGT